MVRDREGTNVYIAAFHKKIHVRLWIDVPNYFPWRRCLQLWTSKLITYTCHVDGDNAVKQTFTLVPIHPSQYKFQLRFNDLKCLEPRLDKSILVGTCSDGTYWRWTEDALLEWSGGGCLSSTGGQTPTVITACDKKEEDQIVEVGVVNNTLLQPFDLDFWNTRMTKTRDEAMRSAKLEVDRVIQEINKTQHGDQGNRRAVVFYVDNDKSSLEFIKWWVFAWKQIGLNGEQEAFDIIMMTHPLSVSNLPEECVEAPTDFDPAVVQGPGQCLWKSLLPISERDRRHYNHLNSLECLANSPTADFLIKYKILLRADLDTFPTPGMLRLWPATDLICYRNAHTTHHKANIENAIIATAKAAGIVHHHWHNTDSTVMGPAHRVIALSKLSTVLSMFVRAHMFGPGTVCRCATCTQLPQECQWGKGIFAGTMLLYTQEIAMNHIWTQREYDQGSVAILDSSTTDDKIHVCKPALLHARHSDKPFSKFDFVANKYKDFDMTNLDITNVRDYAIYMALSSKNQGKGRSKAWDKYQKKEQKPLSKLCDYKDDPPWISSSTNSSNKSP